MLNSVKDRLKMGQLQWLIISLLSFLNKLLKLSRIQKYSSTKSDKTYLFQHEVDTKKLQLYFTVVVRDGELTPSFLLVLLYCARS